MRQTDKNKERKLNCQHEPLTESVDKLRHTCFEIPEYLSAWSTISTVTGILYWRPLSSLSDGPIHVIKYSNSIQEINWLYSLFASVIPGVSTRSLDRTKLIVYTTSLPHSLKIATLHACKISPPVSIVAVVVKHSCLSPVRS